MSSVQSFLRQRVVGTTTLNADGATLYTFVAGSGNYVGNYPPGYLVDATLPSLTGLVLRDLGKTIKAGYSGQGTGTDVGSAGFWRAVQVISPVAVASPTASSTFGVGVAGQGAADGVPQGLPSGGNAGDAGYGTFYLPIVVGGVIAEGVTASTQSLIAGNVL